MMRKGELGRGVILRHDLYEDYDLWCIMGGIRHCANGIWFVGVGFVIPFLLYMLFLVCTLG